MSPLEQRYRQLLRLLPEPARSRWTEDMVETYLTATTADDPEYAEFGSPTPADRLDVWRLALRLRLGAPGATDRAVAAGRTVWLVALIGTAALAAQSLIGLATAAWVRGLVPGVPAPQLPGPLVWGPGDVVALAVDVLLVALAVCLFRGAWIARPLAAGALLGAAIGVLVRVDGPGALPAALWLGTAAVPLLAAAVVPVESIARRDRWQVGLPVLATVLVTVLGPVAAGAVSVAAGPPDEPAAWLLALGQPVGPWALAVVAAGLVVLSRRAATAVARLAVALLGLALLPALAGQLAYDLPGYRAVVVAGLVLLTATVLATGLSGGRAVRDLPAGVPADRNG